MRQRCQGLPKRSGGDARRLVWQLSQTSASRPPSAHGAGVPGWADPTAPRSAALPPTEIGRRPAVVQGVEGEQPGGVGTSRLRRRHEPRVLAIGGLPIAMWTLFPNPNPVLASWFAAQQKLLRDACSGMRPAALVPRKTVPLGCSVGLMTTLFRPSHRRWGQNARRCLKPT